MAEELSSWRRGGYTIVCVLGVEGSPSCSVCRGPRLVDGRRVMRRGRGIFIAALRDAIRNQGLRIPFLGVPEEAEAGKLAESLDRIRKSLIASIESMLKQQHAFDRSAPGLFVSDHLQR